MRLRGNRGLRRRDSTSGAFVAALFASFRHTRMNVSTNSGIAAGSDAMFSAARVNVGMPWLRGAAMPLKTQSRRPSPPRSDWPCRLFYSPALTLNATSFKSCDLLMTALVAPLSKAPATPATPTGAGTPPTSQQDFAPWARHPPSVPPQKRFPHLPKTSDIPPPAKRGGRRLAPAATQPEGGNSRASRRPRHLWRRRSGPRTQAVSWEIR